MTMIEEILAHTSTLNRELTHKVMNRELVSCCSPTMSDLRFHIFCSVRSLRGDFEQVVRPMMVGHYTRTWSCVDGVDGDQAISLCIALIPERLPLRSIKGSANILANIPTQRFLVIQNTVSLARNVRIFQLSS